MPVERISLKAEERTVLGKKVKVLRRQGLIPAHVFGKKIETEHVSVRADDFNKVYAKVGETGLVDLKIGAEKVRPVLIREVQLDVLKNTPLHIDFYQVNLAEKVTVSVPVVLAGTEPDLVSLGEAVVIQPMSGVEVEALPADLPENIEVDQSSLKQIGDVIIVSQLVVPSGVTVLVDPEAVVIKLDSAVTQEMKALLAEQEAEAQAVAAAAAAEVGVEEGAKAPAEGEEETKAPSEEETPTEGEEKKDESSEEKPQE